MPASSQSNTTAGTGIRWIAGTLLWFALFAALVIVVPAEKKTFDEWGLAVPAITMVVLDISMWFVDYWLFMVPAFVVAALVAGLITCLVRHRTDNHVLMACWTIVLMGTPLVLGAVVAYSLSVVHVKLSEGLNK